jgi:hypothetical protein
MDVVVVAHGKTADSLVATHLSAMDTGVLVCNSTLDSLIAALLS